jgi:cell pole-organizing protein PopZ
MTNKASTKNPQAPRAGEKKPAQARRFETLARIAEDIVSDARVVAPRRDSSMAELISDTLRPILKKAMTDDLRKRVEGGIK